MRPDKVMRGYTLDYSLIGDYVKGLHPEDIEVWERKVSGRAGAVAGFPSSYGDMTIWVPREITFDELMEILAHAEEDTRRTLARVYGSEEGRAAPLLQGVSGAA